jgi:hypothetical protein
MVGQLARDSTRPGGAVFSVGTPKRPAEEWSNPRRAHLVPVDRVLGVVAPEADATASEGRVD